LVEDRFTLEPGPDGRTVLALYDCADRPPRPRHLLATAPLSLDHIAQGLRGWLTEHTGDIEYPPYLDIRHGPDLDMSPPGLVQPARFGCSQGGKNGHSLAAHHFNGPWPLLRLTFQVRKPTRNRAFVTLGLTETRDLHHLITSWIAEQPNAQDQTNSAAAGPPS
jgi:hypothetical protein